MAKPTRDNNARQQKRTNKAGATSKASRANNNSKKASGQQQRYASRSGYQYDRDRVAEEIVAITAYYSGSQPEKQGYRRRYTCPECGKNKFDANSRDLISGCWNRECNVPQSVGAVKLIAHFEQLDPERDLKLILQRGYEAAGIPPEVPISETTDAKPGAGANSTDTSGTPSSEGENSRNSQQTPGATAQAAGAVLADPKAEAEPVEDDQGQLDFNDRVYQTVMGWCRLEKHHSEYLVGRGLTPETIAAARLGSISKRRARYVVSQIQRHFSREDLLTVPGFFINDWGNLSFTLNGEFTLIPYFDGGGRISTIEGRVYGEPSKSMPKYLCLRDSGNHVYLFPGTDPNDLIAICEGALGAIAAAQEGLPVGAIQGFRRYKGKPRFDGDERAPPEIDGADFGGQKVSYMPDVDDPPQPEIMDDAPNAARVLIEYQNGKPAIATVPKGKDLDAYLLTLHKSSRRSSLLALLKRATPTATTTDATTDGQVQTQDDTPSGEQTDAGHQDGAENTRTGDDDPDNLYRLFPGSGEGGEKQGSKNKKGRSGKSKNNTASSEDRRKLPHQESRPTPTPTPAEHDFYYWTGREQGRYKPPLPSDAPVTRKELASGLYTGGVVLAALWLLMTLIFVAASALVGAGQSPGFLPAGAYETLTEWATYASDPLIAGIALAGAFAVAAMSALTVISRLSTYRKEHRKLLLGEFKW